MPTIGFLKGFIEPGHLRSKALTILVCLFLSFIFWIINSLSHDFETSIVLPVKPVYNEKLLLIDNLGNSKIKMRVRGYGWTLLSIGLGLEKRYLSIPLQERSSTHYFTQKEILKLAKLEHEDLEVLDIETNDIAIKTKRLPSRKVQLMLDTNSWNTFKAKHPKSKYALKPAKVDIYGTIKTLENLDDTIYLACPPNLNEVLSYYEIVVPKASLKDGYSPTDRVRLYIVKQ